MKKDLHLSSPALPHVENLIMYEFGRIMQEIDSMSSAFSRVKYNTNQLKLNDLIATSEAPFGTHIHVLCYGGTGSGKTWACLLKILDGMAKYPGASCLVVRKHLKEARTGTWKDAIKILETYNVPHKTHKSDLIITLANGSEMWFCSDEALVPHHSDKADALGGTQFSYALVEECDGISDALVKTLTGRMRQNVGVERKLILYTTNPPDETSWVYRRFFELHDPDDPKSRWRAVKMPTEGNREHIGDAYIQSVTEDYSEDPNFYERMREGNFGVVTRGVPYFQKDFMPGFHVYRGDQPLSWSRQYPMLCGWDPGYLGTGVVIAQDDLKLRQLRVYRSYLKQEMLIKDVLDEVLAERDRLFPGAVWIDYIDPAARQKRENGKSTIEIMRDYGLNPRYTIASRGCITSGLNIIIKQLQTIANKRPTLLLDERAKVLIKAFSGGYCNVKSQNKEDREVRPFKDGYYDHIMDAFRYIIVNIRKIGQPHNPEAHGGRDEWMPVGQEGPIRVYDPETNKIFRPGPRIASSASNFKGMRSRL